jgi:PAS domain S-box-containing protein
MNILKTLLDTDSFMPHGHCYTWLPSLMWLHITSDSLITLSYYSIPVILVYFANKKADLPYKWIFLMFGAFIVSCGTTHLMEIVTIYTPLYWISGGIKAITALLSIATAVALVPLVPKALVLRSPTEEETRAQMSAIVESSTDAIIGKTLDGIIQSWNKGAERIYGYFASEVIGKPISLLVPPDRTGEVPALLGRLRHGDHIEHYETVRVRKDGVLIDVSLSLSPIKDGAGHVVAASVIARDITERKRSEERFRRVVESAPNAIVLVDQKGKIVLVNAQTERLFGYARQELHGQPIEMLVPQRFRSHHPGHRDSFFAQPSTRSMGAGRDLYGVRKDGQEVPVEIGLNPIETGEGVQVLASIIDITERKKAEEKIRRLNEELEQKVAERTAQLTTANKELEAFCYFVSHDLRAPLRGIDGFSQLVMESQADRLDPEGVENLRRVRASAKRMGTLIEDLLTLSRFSRSEMRRATVNLSVLANEILHDLQEGDPARRVRCDIAANLVTEGDPSLLRIVLENLIGNAWKFTSKRPAAIIELGVQNSDNQLVYYVRDNGAGFDMTYIGQLFAPFQRLHTDEEFPGSGIGLATTQRIIHRHGGTIWAEGNVDHGATFYFTLQSRVASLASLGREMGHE